jgi:PAS domain S-box-containing protein
MALPSPREPRSARALELALLGLAVLGALAGLEVMERLVPELGEGCKRIGVAIAAALLGVNALRRRDAARRALAGEAAAQTRSILDSAVDAILTIDERGIIDSVNRATTRVFGYSKEELVGRDVKLLMPSPYREEHRGYLERYLATGEPRIIGIGREVVARRADGRSFPIHLTVSEAKVGSRHLFTGIVRDLSEPRHAQEEARRLGAILDQSLNEIFVFDDRSLRFELVSRGARESLDYTLEELQQLTPLELLPELDRQAFEALLEPLRRHRLPRASLKASHRRKDGTFRRVEIQLQHVADAVSGHFVAVSQDISEREELESRLTQAQKLEAIGQLAGGIAHDFNNLLTSILGSSELLAERLPAGDRSQRALARIQQAAERGAALTQKLLAFGRRQAFQAEVLELNAAVEQISELAGRLIAEDIEVALDLQVGLHPVLADRTQLDQVVLNLVVNASDAMPGGGKLTLATRNLELAPERARRLETRAGPAVELSVADTGTGMSPEVLAHIFEPFFTTKEVGKGTGLGLATVYGIVRQNGWGIEVTSEPGRGSTFRLYLPRSAAASTPSRQARADQGRPAEGETLLLVEDDALLRDMATEILEAEGYRVVVAADPEQALRLAAELGPRLSLLISDVVMPHMTGPQLASRLQESLPGLKALLISGYPDEALEARGASPAAEGFLHKPFSNEALIERIRALLDA